MCIRFHALLRVVLILSMLLLFFIVFVSITIRINEHPLNLISISMSFFNIKNNTEDEQTSLDDYSI
jgi:hypothetical protein